MSDAIHLILSFQILNPLFKVLYHWILQLTSILPSVLARFPHLPFVNSNHVHKSCINSYSNNLSNCTNNKILQRFTKSMVNQKQGFFDRRLIRLGQKNTEPQLLFTWSLIKMMTSQKPIWVTFVYYFHHSINKLKKKLKWLQLNLYQIILHVQYVIIQAENVNGFRLKKLNSSFLVTDLRNAHI